MRNTCTAIVVLAANLIVAIAMTLSVVPSEEPEPRPTALGLAMPLVALEAPTAGMPASSAGVPRPVERLTGEEQELVDWARGRFALVGLDLPDVEILFHGDNEPCAGNKGRYRLSGGHARIDVCIADKPTFHFQLQRRRTLIHELAHAWDHANLDDADRMRLLDVVDAESWYAPESHWDERGVERFAETIVWGLYDQLRRPVFIDVPCDELHADFIEITGSNALGPLQPNCDPRA